MTKTYCDVCKSEIDDEVKWKITIERNNGGISCLQLYAKFVYDVCPKCANKIKTITDGKVDEEE